MTVEQQERFSRLKYPIHRVQAKTVAELFKLMPGLKRHFQDGDRLIQAHITDMDTGDDLEFDNAKASPAWGGDVMLKVMKYIVFLYDEGTDLTDEYPDDIRLRKDAAAKEAGFRRERDGEWPLMVQEIMDFRDTTATQMILQYIKVQKSVVWREIKLIEEEIDGLHRARLKAMAEGDFGKSSNDLMQATKIRIEERDNLYKKFYAEHSDLKVATEAELLPVTPENVFKVMKFPEEYTRIMQIKDVPPEARIHTANN